jgi:type II secretory pathway component PulK
MRAWTALTTLTMNGLGLDATTIDLVLADLYAGRMGYTAAAPTATMVGTNADPTGVYQAMVPPTTGMETKYELINDSASQGFKKWAITT